MFDEILVASIPQMHLRSEGARLVCSHETTNIRATPTITPAKALPIAEFVPGPRLESQGQRLSRFGHSWLSQGRMLDESIY